MIVTALIENQGGKELCCEHGLAIHIAYRGKNYLLDAGKTGLCFENADQMGISVEEVDAAFLSHGHYDHAGGFQLFFQRNRKAKLYLQKDALAYNHYKITETMKKNIGIPEGIPENYRERFILLEGDRKIAEGVYLVAHHLPGAEVRSEKAHLYQEKDGIVMLDDLKHEQSLVFETENGLIVFNSCSHSGVENVIREIRDVFPRQKIAAMIGGFHLMGVDGVETMAGTREEVLRLAETLKTFGDFPIYTGHCTGIPAFAILKEVLGDRLSYFSTGCRLRF